MNKSMIAIALALILILSLGVAAFAESPAASTAQDTEATTADAKSAALQDALDAFRSAKRAKRTADLEAELQGYVESGTLTQEQANLILENHKDRQAQRDSERVSGGNPSQSDSRGCRMSNGGRTRGNQPGSDSGAHTGRGRAKVSQANTQPLPEASPNV